MLEVLREDYIRTARAKGLLEKVIINRHALKNSLLPVVTVIGIEFAFLMGGLVVTEQVFNLNGLGKLFVDSVMSSDCSASPKYNRPSILAQPKQILKCGRCDQCHLTEHCPHFSAPRDASNLGSAPMPHMQETRVEFLGRTRNNERVASVNGKDYVVGRASGVENNCLIDTLRQKLGEPLVCLEAARAQDFGLKKDG